MGSTENYLTRVFVLSKENRTKIIILTKIWELKNIVHMFGSSFKI